jgi:single-strand DNA-binding protein
VESERLLLKIEKAREAMANFNNVILMGNITRDPQLRYTPAGTAVIDIGLAVNRVWYDADKNKQEKATFVDITFWGNQAETLGGSIQKGSPLHINGRLELEQWDDKESGQARSKLKVVGEGFQFLGSRPADSNQGQQQQPPAGSRSQPVPDDLPY